MKSITITIAKSTFTRKTKQENKIKIKLHIALIMQKKYLLVNYRRQQYLAPIIVVKMTEEMGRHSLNKQLKPTFNSH